MADTQNKKEIPMSNLQTQNNKWETEFVGGLAKLSIETDIEWIDKTNHIYNEIFYKKLWFCGALIFNRRYKALHTVKDGAITRTGFGS